MDGASLITSLQGIKSEVVMGILYSALLLAVGNYIVKKIVTWAQNKAAYSSLKGCKYLSIGTRLKIDGKIGYITEYDDVWIQIKVGDGLILRPTKNWLDGDWHILILENNDCLCSCKENEPPIITAEISETETEIK